PTGCVELLGDSPEAERRRCLCPLCPLIPCRASGRRDQESRNSLRRRSERDGKSPHRQAFETPAGVAETNGSALAWRLPSRAQPGAPLPTWPPGRGALPPECASPHRTQSERNCFHPHLQKPRTSLARFPRKVPLVGAGSGLRVSTILRTSYARLR